MPGQRERKLTDVMVKAGALRDELDGWREASEAGTRLEKHHSQIRVIVSRLYGLLDKIDGQLGPLRQDAAPGRPFAAIRAVEEKLLTAHTIWEFFRGKLAQRLDSTFADHLRVCDEFAWRCYKPARDRFEEQAARRALSVPLKEPPLSFLNSGWSPYAVAREAAFQVDRAAGGWLAQQDFRDVIEHLPVPVVGVPWFQVAHLPDVLVVGHEVGHIAEWDFQLSADLDQALDAAGLPAERHAAWKSWRAETFADVYGCLAAGPAFAGSLVDFAAQDPDKIAAEKRNAGAWGSYPVTWLRVRVLVETLCALDFKPAAASLMADWRDQYGEPQHLAEFAVDAKAVACSLLDCVCTSLGAKVREILPPFSGTYTQVADDIRNKNALAPEADDPRVLVAAARRLWEIGPDAYMQHGYEAEIRQLVKTPPGTRGTRETDLGDREAAERAHGAAWFDELFTAT